MMVKLKIMLLQLKIFIYNLLIKHFKMWWTLNFNPLIRRQRQNPQSIPIIIINFNQLFYLKKIVHFLLKRNMENIIIIDNLSTYPPLLEYYKTLEGVTVEYMDKNYGHMVFFENIGLQEKYGKGFYVVTDADIDPNPKLSKDFMRVLLDVITKEFQDVNKVGFALDIDSIPDYYLHKDKVLRWEKKFWENQYPKIPSAYYAKIDTTFAIYKPLYPKFYNHIDFLKGIRLAGDFTAIHGGWYVDERSPTVEQVYYKNTASSASSWQLIDQNEKNNMFKILYK